MLLILESWICFLYESLYCFLIENSKCLTPNIFSAGTYECGFTTGSVRHTAKAQLNVVSLPDVITVMTNPLTGDCSEMPATDSVDIVVTTIIPNITESYDVSWSYRGVLQSPLYNTCKTHLQYILNYLSICCSTARCYFILLYIRKNWPISLWEIELVFLIHKYECSWTIRKLLQIVLKY